MHQCASSHTLMPTLVPCLGAHGILVLLSLSRRSWTGTLQGLAMPWKPQESARHAYFMRLALASHQLCVNMSLLTPCCCHNHHQVISLRPWYVGVYYPCLKCPWVSPCKALLHLACHKSQSCHLYAVPLPLVTHELPPCLGWLCCYNNTMPCPSPILV